MIVSVFFYTFPFSTHIVLTFHKFSSLFFLLRYAVKVKSQFNKGAIKTQLNIHPYFPKPKKELRQNIKAHCI